ncbi:MAG: alpha-galactosidase [Planctomycetes bacterium]|nr:alpha-galactosidase [Planctomycetota bacterium]
MLPVAILPALLLPTALVIAACDAAPVASRAPIPPGSLAPEEPRLHLPYKADWLLATGKNPPARVSRFPDRRFVTLDNALVHRTIVLAPDAATTSLGVDDEAELVRALEPEALLTIDGALHAIGGLVGAPDRAFLLPRWLDEATLTPRSTSFRCTGFEEASIEPWLEWKSVRHASSAPWPPRGTAIALRFEGTAAATRGLVVRVHHEIYEGIPVVGKWLEVVNETGRAIEIESCASERLALVEGESSVEKRAGGGWRLPPVDVLSDYAFGGGDLDSSSRVALWLHDPDYGTQVNYRLATPCVLECAPPIGPAQRLAPGATFKSLRTFLVLHDGGSGGATGAADRERRGLALRRAWRTLAPWTSENPLMMHVRSAERGAFRAAIDQCAAVGFEMAIDTFGSGLDMESRDQSYVAAIEEDIDYAHAKGLEVGGYSLFSSRSIAPDVDVIDAATGKPGGAQFGNAPCLASDWGTRYLEQLRWFIESTGLDLLEHDGPYPGDRCASTTHSGHRGLADSQWAQWRRSADFYAWCRARGTYVNQPDFYFLCGGSKTAMGYRETNWSLPRELQPLHARQNIFDGTWEKTPSMGWMFVPLTEYQGGGAAATIEPLSEHLDIYQQHLMSTLGAGVQACWRGPRLFDSDATRELVTRSVAWFKQHRAILESDLIHVKRPDGRDVDVQLHVNPRLEERALAVFFNPLDVAVEREIVLPLYYSGLRERALLITSDGTPHVLDLDARRRASVSVKLAAHGVDWVVLKRGD